MMMNMMIMMTCRDDSDEADDNEFNVLKVQPCYRQRVTHDVMCLSEEPADKYRTVQNVTGSVSYSLSFIS